MTGKARDATARAARIRAIVLDVDGVLTDASLFYGPDGEAIKRFSARDGFALKTAKAEGIRVAILSGRLAPPLRARLADLGVGSKLVIQGSRNKRRDLNDLAARLDLPISEIAFMGDDLPDLPALGEAGLAACPADAAPEVRTRCHLVCKATGGNGAVRELVEYILRARGRWTDLVEAWANGQVEWTLDRSAEKGPSRGRKR